MYSQQLRTRHGPYRQPSLELDSFAMEAKLVGRIGEGPKYVLILIPVYKLLLKERFSYM